MGLTKDQQRCVDTIDRAVVVAAGAGSGKTHTLTERIVHALANGDVSDIGEICAITFTKKAAAELKSRIKSGLREQGLGEQALKADEAWVSTIHGMCARILRAHALELGIDPAFSVIDESMVGGYRARAIDKVLVRAQTTMRSPQLDALFREYPVRSYGFGGASVAGMLDDLVGKASSSDRGADAFVLPGVTLAPAAVLAEALDLAEGLLEASESINQSATCLKWRQQAEAFADAVRSALDGGIEGHREALELAALMKFDGRIGSGDFKARMAESKQMFNMLVMELSLGAARPHLETLVGLAREALEEYRDMKRHDGALDNDDLLVFAAHALENHPDIAARYTDKFKLVMIDEFQDTGQMEVDMVKRFAGQGAKRLCTVGDAQQSIYRFRSADVAVYRRHLESVRSSGEGEVIELSKNFRSHRDVLSFVDRVFEKPEMFGSEFMSLTAGRDEANVRNPFDEGEPRIVVLNTTRPLRGVTGEQAIEVSARRVAREFARLKDAGHAPGEMAVLLGRMKNSGVFAQALRDEGLPCVISGGSVFSSTPEAAAVRSLVRALVNPAETLSLFNALTSPMFGLTADDVFKARGLAGFVRQAHRQTGEDADCGSWSEPLICACAVMGRAWNAVPCEPMSRVVNRVVVDSGWLTRMQAAGPEGLASAANVFKAIRMMESAEESGTYGPVSVMRAFEAKLDHAKEAPGALSVSGSDSVRIMTVHASKGLEFPIVAVAEFKERRAPSDCLIATTVDGDVYLSLNLSRTLSDLGLSVSGDSLAAMTGYVLGELGGEDDLAKLVAEDAGALHRLLAIRGHVSTGDEEEANRLLYVALTRAREALVVSMVGTRTEGNPAGVPNNAFKGVVNGLDPSGEAFVNGRSAIGFGGVHPAIVETVALEPDSDDLAAFAMSSRGTAAPVFAVPDSGGVEKACEREAYRPAREGVFSYSSIADASHEADVLADLAGSFAESVDAAAETQDDCGAMVPPPSRMAAGAARNGAPGYGDPAFGSGPPLGSGLAFDDEEEAYGFDVSAMFDEDRATDLGTAFHRLAQYAVVQKGVGGKLEMPPLERVEALSRTCRLDDAQRRRLDAALQRWLGSRMASSMAALPCLSAEVAFFVPVGGRYLEGEIDLLGFDEDRAHAFVVDYKTGGSADEAADDLRQKHVLQASCYAYAILLQGFAEVDAAFVRVERPCAGASDEPQCVRYHFRAGDLPMLERAITMCMGS